MCQLGAVAMAERGLDHRQILGHYYTGVRLGRLPELPPRKLARVVSK
jgi:peptidoglycan hydrolase-like amidase